MDGNEPQALGSVDLDAVGASVRGDDRKILLLADARKYHTQTRDLHIEELLPMVAGAFGEAANELLGRDVLGAGFEWALVVGDDPSSGWRPSPGIALHGRARCLH